MTKRNMITPAVAVYIKEHVMFPLIAMVFALALTGCASEDFSGDSELANGQDYPISFTASAPSVTRSATGSAAAAKLGNHFVVYGTKHKTHAEIGTQAYDDVVFNSYTLEWEDGSAGTNLTNSSNWEYLGKTSYDANQDMQTIRYWDYGAQYGYTFTAFSSRDISYPAATTDAVAVKKISGAGYAKDKGYTVTIKSTADINNLYFSNRLVPTTADFNKPVQFSFRSIGAKVRVGFYETIPGYKVKIKRFYYDNDATKAITKFTDMINYDGTKFRAALQNVDRYNSKTKTLTVTYNSANYPLITNTSVEYFYNLTLGTNIQGKELGTTSSTAIYDTEDGAYTEVLPFEANNNPMLIKCDYTLEAEDGQGEILEISGAKVVVPTQYVQWHSNCCYTYLFEITANTTGTTGTSGTDPEGLYPVKFDALSVTTEDNDQTTLTSIDKFSVTSLRTGTDVYLINTNKTTGDIYIPTKIGDLAGQAQIYDVTTTGEEISEASIYAYLTGTNNGLYMEPLKFTSGEHLGQFAASLICYVPTSDGSYYQFGDITHPGAVHFTSENGHAYAYVYCSIKHQAAQYAKVASTATYDSATTYYTYSGGVYTAVSGMTEAYFNANKSSLYIQSVAEIPGEYAVMLLDTKGY